MSRQKHGILSLSHTSSVPREPAVTGAKACLLSMRMVAWLSEELLPYIFLFGQCTLLR